MGKVTKRSTEVGDVPEAKKQKTSDKKKVAPQKVDKPKKEIDPIVEAFAKKFVNPEDAIQFLVENAKIPVDDFFSKHWQKAPLHMSAETENKDLVKIFGVESFRKVLEESNDEEDGFEIIPERDFTFVKYVDGKLDTKECQEDLNADLFKECFEKEKYAFKFNQPQRYSNALWSFMEKLECYFGCLVGCKAYLCPEKTKCAGAQYDDSENFILQLEGTQKVCIYKAKIPLANQSEDNIPADTLGDAILDVSVKPGDVIYIPKGCIYTCESVSASTHLLFYTYEHNNIANIIDQTMGNILDKYIKTEEFLREGAPIEYLPSATAFLNKDYAGVLRKLADVIEKDAEPLPPPDNMITEFMANRLPPFGVEEFDPEAAAPKETDKVRIKHKHHICYYEKIDSAGEMDEEMDEAENAEGKEEDLTKKQLVVISSVSNNRHLHMMIDANVLGTESDAFSIPVEYKSIMDTLMKSEEPVSVKSLEGKDANGKDIDVEILIRGLYNFGALEVVSK